MCNKYYILFLIFITTGLFAEVTIPSNPGEPDVRFENKKLFHFSAEIIFASGKNKKGIILIPGQVIKYSNQVNKVRKYEEVSISDIRTIEFYEWKGEKKWKGNYIFYPSFVKIHLKNKKIIEITSNILELNKIEFIEKKKKNLYYTFFYDYRKNNKWMNSGIIDIKYPEKNPHIKTVTKINFIETNRGIDFNKLLKKILQ